LTPSFEGNPCTQWHEIFITINYRLGAAHSEDFVILACTVLIQITSVTDRRTDRCPDDGKDARSILLSRVKSRLDSCRCKRRIYAQTIRDSNCGQNSDYCPFGLVTCKAPLRRSARNRSRLYFLCKHHNHSTSHRSHSYVAHHRRPLQHMLTMAREGKMTKFEIDADIGGLPIQI